MNNNVVINHNGFKARIMEAERLTGDRAFGLPPGTPLPVYKTSAFKQHPENWMLDDGCYVVPVKANKGLWFDWTLNDAENTVVLPSVKGCNPITGQALDGFALESYQNKCPVHGVEFGENLNCPECGFDWAPQNYVCAPNTLWWDGFKDKDGTVRQFFFTEDMMRDIASHKIGKENTVPAFGFAFFSAKEKHLSVKYDKTTGKFISNNPDKMKVIKGFVERAFEYDSHTGNLYSANNIPVSKGVHGMNGVKGTQGVAGYGTRGVPHKLSKSSGDKFARGFTALADTHDSLSFASFADNQVDMVALNCAYLSQPVTSCASQTISSHPDDSITMYRNQFGTDNLTFTVDMQPDFQPKEVAVGAGAKIEQTLLKDKYDINEWKDIPDAVMRIYFIFEDEFNKWASHGFVGENGSMLQGMPVG